MIEVSKAKGSYIYDNDNNRYLDFVAGVSACSVGHCNKEIINAYSVWGEKKFMGKVYDGIHRTTFIINENGIIDNIIGKVKTKNHSEQILELY